MCMPHNGNVEVEVGPMEQHGQQYGQPHAGEALVKDAIVGVDGVGKPLVCPTVVSLRNWVDTAQAYTHYDDTFVVSVAAAAAPVPTPVPALGCIWCWSC